MSDNNQSDRLINLSESSDHEDHPVVINQLPQKKMPGKNVPQITKISPQKKRGRYNIFINQRFAFGVSEDLLVAFGLHKGMEIPLELQDKLRREEQIQKAYQQALNFLAYRQRSAQEIRNYLIEKGYDSEIELAIDKLRHVNLIDDQAFADAYVKTSIVSGKKGPQRIEHELLQKGVALNLIQQSLDQFFTEEDQIDIGLKLAEKKWTTFNNLSNREARQKVNQYLMQRGFSQAIIRQINQAFEPTMDQNSEYEHLKAVADKAWRRYTKRSSGYERDQKLRAYLYRKQYPKALIERYITEKKQAEDE